MPRLERGPCNLPVALAVDESESAEGVVLLLGGAVAGAVEDDAEPGGITRAVWRVDLGTGACAAQPALHTPRMSCAAAALPGGRVVCAGGRGGRSQSAEIWEPAPHGPTGGGELQPRDNELAPW